MEAKEIQEGHLLYLKNELYSIKISIDTTYSVQSSDNNYYDLEWNPEDYGRSDFYKTLAIHIESCNNKLDIALVGDYYSYDYDCAVLDGRILTIMQNNTISQICIDDGALILHKKFACVGCTFGLYQVKNGYIIYGELEIKMLDFNFNQVWSFNGRDIFVSQTRKNTFILGRDSIELYDWMDNFYELDLSGNLISPLQN